jgi:hypothetical protein
MNTLIKLTVAALAIATLAGCASIPQAPKNAQEMAALGDDNLLNVPVDITGFPWKKQEIVAVNGDKGIVTVFTDPKTGLTYDLDGQPVNAKAERVLKNGYVCEVKVIVFNARGYGPLFNSHEDCMTTAFYKKREENGRISNVAKNLGKGMLVGAATLATAGIAGATILSTTTIVTTQEAAEGDTL